VLYQITPEQSEHLDRTEGVPRGTYRRIQINVIVDGGEQIGGFTYQADRISRLKELLAERDEAERFNDIGRASRAREELEFVNVELTTGLGFDGHARQSGTHAERARLLVRKNIRAALDKIRRRDPALGRHFATSISTGYFCAYEPDPAATFSWQLEAD
jgi:hypothetical protein